MSSIALTGHVVFGPPGADEPGWVHGADLSHGAAGRSRGPTISRTVAHCPTQPIVRDQHLGQLQAEMRYQEDLLSRAEENRLQACRTPEATQVDSVAYQRCQLKDQCTNSSKPRPRWPGSVIFGP